MPSIQDLIDMEFAEQQARDYRRFVAARSGRFAPDMRQAAVELRGAIPQMTPVVDVNRTPLPPIADCPLPPLVPLADRLGTGVGIPTFQLTMLHWAKSFAVVAVLVSFAALWLYPAPLGALAVFMTAVFVTLAILSLITGALGKRRDGWSYSATQALGAVAIMAGAVFLLSEWIVGIGD